MSSLIFQQSLSPCRPEVNELTHMDRGEQNTLHIIACWNVARCSKPPFGITFHFQPFEPYLTNVNYQRILFSFSQTKSFFVSQE